MKRALGLLALCAVSAGAYEEAGHYYTIGIVLSGLGYPNAPIATFCAQLPDEAPELDAATRFTQHKWDMVQWGLWHGGNRDVLGRIFVIHELLHSLNDSSVERFEPRAQAVVAELLDRAINSQQPADFCAFGFSLHMLGDAFAHRRLDEPARMYAPGFGHATAGTLPDYPLYEHHPDRPWHEKNWETYLHAVAQIVSERLGLHERAELDQQLALARGIHSDAFLIGAFDQERRFTQQLQGTLKDWFAQQAMPEIYGRAVDPKVKCQGVIDQFRPQHAFLRSLQCDDVWNRYRRVAEPKLKDLDDTGVPFFPGPGLP